MILPLYFKSDFIERGARSKVAFTLRSREVVSQTSNNDQSFCSVVHPEIAGF
jgi:hypothetical protein